MKTLSGSSTLIWNLTQTSFVLTLWVMVGERVAVCKQREEDWTPVGCEGELNDLHMGTRTNSKWGKLAELGHPVKVFCFPQMKWNQIDIFWTEEHVSAKSELPSARNNNETEREGLKLVQSLWEWDSVVGVNLQRSHTATRANMKWHERVDS